MFPEISWFYGSPVLLAVLIIAMVALAAALIVGTVRAHRHPNGGRR
ncbi:hypothetical protein HC028_23520 [Planosporangium flavigriseum]|uniref:Uncharacterized protein n=1 Tax=Planosporangium flavigriseum TaxID=373681 RepID=A0A8J3PNH5_9ACTN|nr:hypothetical protein [Planosporangium flavigriseum]NJC67445.1 hypothetical protein [Planosporangium flavigriseum]GIG74913.1 hypothetical protein Pfl04_33170 [Planosporangium flavigriseum]